VLAAERQNRILDEVQQRGAVRVSELSRQLDVSDMTIRRDLDTLAAQGRLEKVHGGATTKRPPSTEEPGFEAKWVRQTAEKNAIAAAAVSLVAPGSAVGLSAGTTTWTLARELAAVPGLTVVTNSTRVADVLLSVGRASGARTGHGPANVILTGGVRTPSDALVGPIAVAALQSLHLDLVFLGVHGMDPRAGYTTPNMLEADTDRALVAAGRRLVVVADHTKWETVGISTIVDLPEADVVVTDHHLSVDAQATLRESVGQVIVANSGARLETLGAAEERLEHHDHDQEHTADDRLHRGVQ
jgi:DeoR/GlpR family transcriptional regulator of sugar metabolism